MKALVTGATGFIGSHLCEELIRKGYEVACLSRNNSNIKWLESSGVKFLKGDCTIPESLNCVIDEFDYIFHLAGLTKSTSKEAFFNVNTTGTENLLKKISNNSRLKRFIFISSLAAIGPGKDGVPINEKSFPSPVSDYGKSKLEAEKAVLKYKGKIPFTILRPPAIYGPRDKDMLVMFRMIKKGFFFDLGKCYYSLLYVEDLIHGIILCAENEKAKDNIYFLSDNKSYTGEQIAMEISSALNVNAKPIKVPKFVMPFVAFISEKMNRQSIINRYRIKDFQHDYWVCDSMKIKNEIGFNPKVGLKEGIKWTADWYRIHKWL